MHFKILLLTLFFTMGGRSEPLPPGWTAPSPGERVNLLLRDGQLEKAKSLIARGVFYEVKLDNSKPREESTILVATEYGYYDVVELLLEKGASPNGFRMAPSSIPKVTETALNSALGESYRNVPAHKMYAIARLLLRKGADPNLGIPALHSFVERSEPYLGNIFDDESLHLLLEKGANPNLLERVYGYNAVQKAKFRSSYEVFRRLIEAGGDPTQVPQGWPSDGTLRMGCDSYAENCTKKNRYLCSLKRYESVYKKTCAEMGFKNEGSSPSVSIPAQSIVRKISKISLVGSTLDIQFFNREPKLLVTRSKGFEVRDLRSGSIEVEQNVRGTFPYSELQRVVPTDDDKLVATWNLELRADLLDLNGKSLKSFFVPQSFCEVMDFDFFGFTEGSRLASVVKECSSAFFFNAKSGDQLEAVRLINSKGTRYLSRDLRTQWLKMMGPGELLFSTNLGVMRWKSGSEKLDRHWQEWSNSALAGSKILTSKPEFEGNGCDSLALWDIQTPDSETPTVLALESRANDNTACQRGRFLIGNSKNSEFLVLSDEGVLYRIDALNKKVVERQTLGHDFNLTEIQSVRLSSDGKFLALGRHLSGNGSVEVYQVLERK